MEIIDTQERLRHDTWSGDTAYMSHATLHRPRNLDLILESTALTDDDKANLVGRNVRRLFGMPLEGGPS